MNEVHLMGQQQHPAVLPLYAAFLVDDQLWMVLPYVAGGSAEDVLKRQGTPVRVRVKCPDTGQGSARNNENPYMGRRQDIGLVLW